MSEKFRLCGCCPLDLSDYRGSGDNLNGLVIGCAHLVGGQGPCLGHLATICFSRAQVLAWCEQMQDQINLRESRLTFREVMARAQVLPEKSLQPKVEIEGVIADFLLGAAQQAMARTQQLQAMAAVLRLQGVRFTGVVHPRPGHHREAFFAPGSEERN